MVVITLMAIYGQIHNHHIAISGPLCAGSSHYWCWDSMAHQHVPQENRNQFPKEINQSTSFVAKTKKPALHGWAIYQHYIYIYMGYMGTGDFC